jgi:hypothetical protein
MAFKGLNADKVREYARAGAETALKQLRAEIIAIERAFPELALPQRRRAVRQAVTEAKDTRPANVGNRAEGGL